ncbi:prevent-host-death family protein [Micromonospora sp. M42]|uniref:type II toxin-antitoxin system Phd/YefM family antitoxin n=1 Tax=Actinomycetes TaxID=1760 RepID=UPI0003EEE172|nr:prevent-host-death family protein [Micromonospora sp. M42]
MYNVTATDFRDQVAELIRKAESGETVGVTKYGTVKAVLISQERFERLTRELMSK